MNKMSAFVLALLLSACGGKGGIVGLPQLSAGEVIIRHYNCENAEGMDVEYAQMGGVYSATMKIHENKKVLNREEDGVFRLENWAWRSEDNHSFTLLEAGQALRLKCVAMNEAAVDDLRSVRKGFLGNEKDFERSSHR